MQREPRRTATSGAGRSARCDRRTLGAVLVVGLLAAAGLVAVLGPLGPRTGRPAAVPASGRTDPAWAVHRSAAPRSAGAHPLANLGPSGASYQVCNTGYPGANGSNYTSQGGWVHCFNYTLPNGSLCLPAPANATLANLGLNLTVASTPANGTGPAPLNFSWNITVNGGGLPPYLVDLVIYDGVSMYSSTNLTGSQDLSSPGLYSVDVMAEDSTCSQTAFVSFPLEVYGALGPNPVRIAANVSSATAPAAVRYTVNTTGFPSNVTVLWTSPGTFGQSSPEGIANLTYFVPGTYRASACLGVLGAFGEPTGLLLACGSSPNVTVGGRSPVTTAFTVTPGPYPTNITFWANLTNATGLPKGTGLYLIAYSATGLGTWNETFQGASVNVTIPAGCGRPWTTYVPPDGNCSFLADFSLDGPLNGVDAGFLAFGSIVANLTANGSPSLWDPAISWSHGPLNGTLPFNLTVNLSVSGGAPPYQVSYSVYGRTNGSGNASFYPTVNGTQTGWNGSAISLTVVLNRTGVYYAAYFVADSDDSWVGFALPLVVLGNVSAAAMPLGVSTSVRGGNGGGENVSSLSAGTEAYFLATPTGGTGPYAIQWAFGDGSYGSAAPGIPVGHSYALPGTYVPSVTITDATGRTIERTLPAISVTSGASGGTTSRSGSLSAGGGSAGPGSVAIEPSALVGAGLVAAGLVGTGLFAARRELRRQGEELVARIGEPPAADRPPEDPDGSHAPPLR